MISRACVHLRLFPEVFRSSVLANIPGTLTPSHHKRVTVYYSSTQSVKNRETRIDKSRTDEDILCQLDTLLSSLETELKHENDDETD